MEIRKCKKCGLPEDIEVVLGDYTYLGLVERRIIPGGEGGKNIKENRILVCEECHRKMHTKNGKLNYKL